MSTHQHATIADTVYLYFGANNTSGSGADGATPTFDVRLAGAAAGAAPVFANQTATLLTHASFPPGAHEVAVVASVGNGFAAGNTYAVFVTLLVDSQNPTGFVGSFTLAPIISDLQEIGGDAQSAADLKDFADAGYDPGTNKVQGVVLVDTTTTNTDKNTIAATDIVSAGAIITLSGAVVNVDTVDTVTTVTGGATETKQDTAQTDLDTITGADGTTLSSASEASAVDAVWDELLTGSLHNIATSAGKRLRQITSPIITEGPSAGSNAATYINLEVATASAMDGAYDPGVIFITTGTGAGQSRQIFEYDGTLRRAFINRDWKSIPALNDEYVIVASSGNTHVNEGVAGGGGASTITLNSLASSVDDTYVDQIVFIVAGTGQDQAGNITAYNGTSKVATVEHAWQTQPIAGSIYAVLPCGMHSITEIQSGVATEAKQDTMQTDINSIGSEVGTIDGKIGTPANIDTGGATLADNLKKLADDNNGVDFDATTDSQQAIRDRGDAAWTSATGFATEAKQDAGDTVRDRITDIQEADRTIDFTAGTLIYETKGTATVLLTKNLKDPAGAAVNSTEDVIAAEENV